MKALSHIAVVLFVIVSHFHTSKLRADEGGTPARNVPAAPSGEEPSTLRIEVLKENWGDAPAADILAVCVSAGSELTKYFHGRTFSPIQVGNSERGVPITLFKKGPNGEIRVELTTRGTFWCQYAYQFGHELCHILCNCRPDQNPQKWFEESLCETASIFVVRRMAESWRIAPPYPNWSSYADALAKYADEHVSKTDTINEASFAEWYRLHQTGLQMTGTNRQLNQIVAVRVLLPLLEKEPRHWRSLNWLNQWDPNDRLTFTDYLQDWHTRVPDEHKPFVAAIAAQFETLLK